MQWLSHSHISILWEPHGMMVSLSQRKTDWLLARCFLHHIWTHWVPFRLQLSLLQMITGSTFLLDAYCCMRLLCRSYYPQIKPTLKQPESNLLVTKFTLLYIPDDKILLGPLHRDGPTYGRKEGIIYLYWVKSMWETSSERNILSVLEKSYAPGALGKYLKWSGFSTSWHWQLLCNIVW